MIRAITFLVFASLAGAECVPGQNQPANRPAELRPGIENFLARPPEVVRGKRIGLITNQSGMNRKRESTIDLIRALPDVKLVALFSPEHGIRGVADERVASSTDE